MYGHSELDAARIIQVINCWAYVIESCKQAAWTAREMRRKMSKVEEEFEDIVSEIEGSLAIVEFKELFEHCPFRKTIRVPLVSNPLLEYVPSI